MSEAQAPEKIKAIKPKKDGLLKVKIIELSEPWKLNGSEVNELKLDFSDIDGKELKALAAAFTEIYKDFVPMLQLDFRFLELVAGRAAHMNPQDLATMWGPDYMEVLTVARNFLLKSG